MHSSHQFTVLSPTPLLLAAIHQNVQVMRSSLIQRDSMHKYLEWMMGKCNKHR